MEWLVTYGIPQGRGGWLITEQRTIAAVDYVTAQNFARYAAMRGEKVQSITEAKCHAR